MGIKIFPSLSLSPSLFPSVLVGLAVTKTVNGRFSQGWGQGSACSASCMVYLLHVQKEEMHRQDKPQNILSSPYSLWLGSVLSQLFVLHWTKEKICSNAFISPTSLYFVSY